MPSKVSFCNFSTKNGNKIKNINTGIYSGTSNENLIQSQNDIFKSLHQMIVNLKYPNYTLPTPLQTNGVENIVINVINKNEAVLGDTQYENYIVIIRNKDISFNFYPGPENFTHNLDVTPTDTIDITVSTFTHSLIYTYNSLTGELNLNFFNDQYPNTVEIDTNLTTLASRTPYNGTLPVDATTASSDFSYSITLDGSPATGSIVIDNFSSISTSYSFNYTGRVSATGDTDLSFISISNEEIPSETPLFYLYDPTSSQSPAPSAAVLAGYLADDPTYTIGGIGPNDITFFTTIADLYFGIARKFSEYIYGKDTDAETCANEDNSGLSLSKTNCNCTQGLTLTSN